MAQVPLVTGGQPAPTPCNQGMASGQLTWASDEMGPLLAAVRLGNGGLFVWAGPEEALPPWAL